VSVGEVSDTPVVITETNFAMRSESFMTSNLLGKEHTVQPGGPTVTFSSEITALLPSSVPLVLVNINSKTIGTGSRRLAISTTLFSVSTGDIKISGLKEPIRFNFPKVRL